MYYGIGDVVGHKMIRKGRAGERYRVNNVPCN